MAISKKKQIRRFLEEPGNEVEIFDLLDQNIDLYPAEDRFCLELAFRSFLPENAEWRLGNLDKQLVRGTARGLDLLLQFSEIGGTNFQKARIHYMCGTMAMLLGKTGKARKAFFAALDKFPVSDGVYRAGVLLHLANLLMESGKNTYQGYSVKEFCERACDGFDREDDPFLFGEIKQTLGIHLLGLGAGYRDPILEKAILAFQISIDAFESVDQIEEKARSQIYLSFALSETFKREQTARSEEAILLAESALHNIKRKNDQILWATAQTALGSALWERVTGRREDNLARAEKAHRAALRVYRLEIDPYGRAQSLVNLASVAIQQIPFTKTSAEESAIRYCREALKLCDENAPIEIKLTAMLNLSSALSDRSTGNALRNCNAAIKVLEQAYQLATENNHPTAPMLRLNKAVILIDISQNHSVDCVEEAAGILNSIDGSFDPSENPGNWLRYKRHCALVAGLQDHSRDLWDIATEVFDHAMALISATKNLDEKMRLISEMSDICDLGIIGAMLESGPEAAIQSGLRFYGILFDQGELQLAKLKRNEAQLYFFNPQIEEWALVVACFADEKQLIMLPKLGYDFWAEPQNGGEESYLEIRKTFTDDQFSAHFKKALKRWVDELSDGNKRLVEKLHDHGIERLSIHAHGKWSEVPFGALRSFETGQTWSDQFALAYGSLPKTSYLRNITHVTHIVDKGLMQAAAETEALKERFQITQSPNTLKDIQIALKNHSQLGILHFTCHGQHDFGYIDGGGIRCPDQNILTARWVYENAMLKDCSLVVIAACETGVSDYNRLPNEGFGLPRSFLEAGAKAVISTLWPVDDLATRILIERFYDELASGTDIAKALSRSQRYLRELSIGQLHNHLRWQTSLRLVDQEDDERDTDPYPFAHPFYWAGYILHQG